MAYGSCAYEGCIPALSNLTTAEATFNAVYHDNPSIDNPEGVRPQLVSQVPEGELSLPSFYNTVKSLDQVVPVDYYLPGCPPEPPQIWAVLEAVVAALTEGAELPPPGSVVGVGTVAVCEECPLEKNEKTIKRFYRPYEITPEPGICLLEQGLVCMGPATVSGCGALCPAVGAACIGCYGPAEGVLDYGARLMTAVASVIDSDDPDEIEEILDGIVDPAGTFYRFSLPHSLLQAAKPAWAGD